MTTASATSRPKSPAATRLAIDIGSTVVKVARLGSAGDVIEQRFHPRDFDNGIARQIDSILGELAVPCDASDLAVCSSANGGLRVGIVCLTPHYSGSVFRNQVLLAGANPIFVHDLDDERGDPSRVDILLVGGGIDCEDAGPLAARLQRFRPERYRFDSLVYAGNAYLSDTVRKIFPATVVVDNPLADRLFSRSQSVFEVVRRAYLDDLIFKEGVSDLRRRLANGIRPTPEIVNRGLQRAVHHASDVVISGPCVLIDIGGATTDLHYTVEIVRDESEEKPSPGSSVARYVFTDLGIVASRDSLLLQLRSHPRLYEFLDTVFDDDVREIYRLLREGDYEPSGELLSYGCLFVALDRFAHGRGPGLPTANLAKLSQVILTGGAAQTLCEDKVASMIRRLLRDDNGTPEVSVDRRYRIWVDGITWADSVAS